MTTDVMEMIRNGFSPVALLVFASVFAALYAAHHVGDHWVQTHRQASMKSEPGKTGQWACFEHVFWLTVTKAAALALLWYVTRLPLGWTLAPALLIDAASHYWADRRYTLHALAKRLGKTDFYNLGLPKAAPCGTGAYALDQSWHVGWLFLTSLITAVGA